MPLKSTNGHDETHTNHLIPAGPYFRNLLCELMNNLISHDFLPWGMFLLKIRPTVKNSAGNKTRSSNYSTVMNTRNLRKLFEYLILPHREKYLFSSHNQFAYRPSVGGPNAINVNKYSLFQHIQPYNITRL